MTSGVDPRMVAYFHARQQRIQLQQQGQAAAAASLNMNANANANANNTTANTAPNTTGNPGQQKPGGEADVASFLLQLKTNQNGEQVPVTEAEARKLQAEHHQYVLNVNAHAARLVGAPPSHSPLHHHQTHQQHANANANANSHSHPQHSHSHSQLQGSPVAAFQGFPGAPPVGATAGMPMNMNMNINGYGVGVGVGVGYPGMNHFAALPHAMGGMPTGIPAMPTPPSVGYQMPPGVTVNVGSNVGVGVGVGVGVNVGIGTGTGTGTGTGIPPMGDPNGGIPGMNHASSLPMGVPGRSRAEAGGSASNGSDLGFTMTDAYIESLISNNLVVNGTTDNHKGSETNNNNNNNNSQASTEGGKKNKHEPSSSATTRADGNISAKDDMNVQLVVPKDRDLIPDSLFVALGQMKPTRLQQSDRVGCYKTRHLGFLGMVCKHCGGQPGYGRYFPNSVRSLAQTTTSQTILKHIESKCRMCPPAVRKAVQELKRQQAHKEHLSSGRPRYGSRKIFFQRMWARLHGQSADGDSAVVVQSEVSPEIARAEAEEAAALESGGTTNANQNANRNAADAKNDNANQNAKALNSLVLPIRTTTTITATANSTNEELSNNVVCSPPSAKVSNNNTDEDDDIQDNNPNLVKIQLSLKNSNNNTVNGTDNNYNGNNKSSSKKRKLDSTTAAIDVNDATSELHDDDETTKKLRMSEVEKVEV